jgi:predicted nucleic acid-binding protein
MIEGFEKDGWITIEPLRLRYARLAHELGKTIGDGEAQAIALAFQDRLRLLIDDDHGRRVAGYYKVDTLSTLGILLEFLITGKITKQEYAANVRRFSSQAWIASDIVNEFLEKAVGID